MSENKKKSGLFVGHFGKPGNAPPPGDPLSITTMVVDVDRISFFEGNPRRSPNEKYAEIKESIRTTGLDNPLPISRRPSDPVGHYIIYKGGNTRLRALKELWEETNDPQFLKVRCEFHPYVSEFDALIAHLRENELRGGMTFIDRALAVQDARAKLEADIGEPLSLRKLEAAFKDKGFPISIGMMSKLEYAAKLGEVIPVALQAGMGKPQIEKLAKLEKAAGSVWQFHGNANGAESQFREIVFLPALKNSDSDSWNYDTAETLVRNSLLDVLPEGADSETVAINFQLAMAGKELKAKEPELVSSQAEPARPIEQPPIERDISDSQGVEIDAQGTTNTTDLDADFGDGQIDFASIEGLLPIVPPREVIISGSGRWLDKLKSLRETCYELAAKLADGIPKGRESLTQVDVGYGFLVTDVFNEGYMTHLHARVRDEGNDPADREQASFSLDHANALWWFLVEMSGSFADQLNKAYTCPDHVIEPLVSPNSYIRDPAILHQFHAIVHHPERLRALWVFLPAGRRQAALELIGTVPLIVELVLEHSKDADGAGVWEVATP